MWCLTEFSGACVIVLIMTAFREFIDPVALWSIHSQTNPITARISCLLQEPFPSVLGAISSPATQTHERIFTWRNDSKSLNQAPSGMLMFCWELDVLTAKKGFLHNFLSLQEAFLSSPLFSSVYLRPVHFTFKDYTGESILAQLMTTKEIAKYLKLHAITICKLSKEGKIPSIRIGRVWRFDKEVIDSWIAGD